MAEQELAVRKPVDLKLHALPGAPSPTFGSPFSPVQRSAGNMAIQNAALSGSSPQLRLPQIGESVAGPQRPALTVFSLGFHLVPEDRRRIDAFLAEHRFGVGPKLTPALDGMSTTLDGVVKAVRPLVESIIPTSEIEDLVITHWQRMVGQSLLQIPNTLPPVSIPSRAWTFTAGVNLAWHINVTEKPGASGDATLQFQLSEEGNLQRIIQFGYNVNTHQFLGLVGGQAEADLDLVKNLLTLQGFVQIVVGVAWSGETAAGIAQTSAGGQLTLTVHPFRYIRGLRRIEDLRDVPVQLAVQAAVGQTVQQGQPTTWDFNLTPQVTVPLGSTPKKKTTAKPEGAFEIREWLERARPSEIERLSTDEKTRFVSVLLGGETVIDADIDAVARIWHSVSSPGERQELRQFILARIPNIAVPRLQKRLTDMLAWDWPSPFSELRIPVDEIRARVSEAKLETFETEVSGQGARSNLASPMNLVELVRTIGEGMKAAGRTATRARIDLPIGALPPLWSDFRDGLQKVVDEIIAVDPRLNHFEQVDITIYRMRAIDIEVYKGTSGERREQAEKGTPERTFHIFPSSFALRGRIWD